MVTADRPMRASTLVFICGVAAARRRLAQGRTAKRSRVETQAKTTTCAHTGPPRKDVSPPPSAPPAIMRKVRSAVIVSMTTRSSAPATQNSHSMRTS